MRKSLFLIFVLLVFGAFAIYSYGDGEARVFFVGDISLDRHIRVVAEKRGGDFLFSCIGDFLKEADVVVGNLEGPITEKESISKGSAIGSPQNFIFTFPTTTAKLLYKYNIRLVNLGNNHSDDFGKEGLLSTQKYLDDAGIKYFGGVFGLEPIVYKNIGGIDFVFISYNQFGGLSREEVAKIIKKEKADENKIVVYTHWGEEYVPPSESIKDTARLFADSGADFVIGSHPHVVLERESFDSAQDKKTIIYYSLGNFLFDQYWNNDVSTGLVLELNIKNKKIAIAEHKVSLGRDGRTCLK